MSSTAHPRPLSQVAIAADDGDPIAVPDMGRAPSTDGSVPDMAMVEQELSALLGAGQVTRDPVSLLAYGRDAYPVAIRESLRGDARFEPSVVAWPRSTQEVVGILAIAGRHRLPVVPYGAGSGIVGGALGGAHRMTLDLKRLARFVELDPVSMTATVEAGMLGKDLEDRLNSDGFTCGHYPQSLFSSTVGGWVAHRGVGTFSTRYGKIDDMVLGLQVVLPDGVVADFKAEPQSAAGPDLKRLFLGSEGTFGVITQVTLQVYPLPESRRLLGFGCRTFDVALDAVRRIVQAGYRPAAVRIYDAEEARIQLGTDPTSADALLIAIIEGPESLVEATTGAFAGTAASLGLTDLGDRYASSWLESRFTTAGLVTTNESLLGIADALEVANGWSRLGETYARMKAAMELAVGDNGRVFGHASHFYHSGANLYMIFHARAETPDQVETRYRAVLDAAFDACLATGGTLTHHHGVGLGKRRYMERELGVGGHALLSRIRQAIDPNGLMNPGKLTGGDG